MALNVGSKAPDFTLVRKTGEGMNPVKLSDNFGKKNTVLLFVPLAFTSVCTKELCDVSSGIQAYEGLNAAVYGISVDSPFAQEQWAEKEKITIPLLSDLNKTTSKDYGVLTDLLGFQVSTRAAFVIDKEGVVQHAEVLEDVRNLPDFEAVKAALGKCN